MNRRNNSWNNPMGRGTALKNMMLGIGAGILAVNSGYLTWAGGEMG